MKTAKKLKPKRRAKAAPKCDRCKDTGEVETSEPGSPFGVGLASCPDCAAPSKSAHMSCRPCCRPCCVLLAGHRGACSSTDRSPMHGKKRIAVQQAAAPTPAEDVALLRRRLGGSIARKDEAAAIDRIAAALASAEERIQAAVLEERSAAARLCETAALPFPMEWWNDTKKGISAKTATALAAAIRARGGA